MFQVLSNPKVHVNRFKKLGLEFKHMTLKHSQISVNFATGANVNCFPPIVMLIAHTLLHRVI